VLRRKAASGWLWITTFAPSLNHHRYFWSNFFRRQHLFSKLNDRKNLEGEDEGERSELEYLQKIRDIRDNDPGLFERVKRLPKKARSGRVWPTGGDTGSDAVVTFFRKGKLKKFCLASEITVRELTFFEAADCFACEPDAKRLPLPKVFYPLLEKNKQEFDLLPFHQLLV